MEAVRLGELVLMGRELAVSSDRVLELALRSGCSTCDCEYVALAQELDLPLATLDRELLAAFPATAVRPG